ncbi:hypothetical protein NQZ79_g4092 [Umbelopsis isabellina]|nr:hypothetical protein NQZ79_g4092 [Umbelopsis isabellina]
MQQDEIAVKDLAIQVDNLTFGYGGPDILRDLSLRLPRGSRCLLVGANGAGKTTLLRILAGKRMTPGVVKILGLNAFVDAPKGVTYLGTEWAGNPTVRGDLRVDYLIRSVGGDRWPERRDKLIEVLDVDVTWRMHQVSDGQRRRVQLVMGLLAPWDILLLDEVTVDLDVLVRSDFLNYLQEETAARNSSILYATHIFDGLGEWPTHIAHMADGTVMSHNSTDNYPEFDAFKTRHRQENRVDSPLMALCLSLLRQDKQRQLAGNASGDKRQIDSWTGQPHTKWDDLSEDMKSYGDKYTLLNHIKSNADKLSPETRRTFLILLRAFALGWSVSGLPALLENATATVKDQKRLVISSMIASALTLFSVHRLFPRTGTLDITLFAAVRAGDVFAHRFGESDYAKKKIPTWMLYNGDVIVFVLACTEIMFSWFFAPTRLPRSYDNWISRMAAMDQRLLEALRMIRTGDFVYGNYTEKSSLLIKYCEDIGLPISYGDPRTGRIHCEIVHDGFPGGCEGNALRRFARGFSQAFMIYLPVHLLPPLLFRRKKTLENPIDSAIHILKAAMRSSTFLATFIALTWYGVCLTRTRVGHQLFNINQAKLDNTLAPLVGCMMCGFSLLIENKHRRGEMALYVAPRAIYSLMERVLGPHRRGRPWEKKVAEASEIVIFASAVSTVLEAMYRRDDMVRSSVKGLMKWVQVL